jgi:methionyl-tRNA formyltransferase
MLRVVFMGTPEFAVPTLAGIVGAGHEVVAVYTQPPRPAGRGMGPRKSPVHQFAEQRVVPVLLPTTLRSEEAGRVFAAHGADVAVVVAYGLILPAAVLAAPAHGCLNLHASALPRWRGAAPIQRAIMAGDAETAATVMRMDAGLDTGPVCMTERVAIGPDVTAGELHDLLAENGARLMVRALAGLVLRQAQHGGGLAQGGGGLECSPQPAEGVTYAAKIDKAETRIDFARPAGEVHNKVRGLSPAPGAWLEATHEGHAERIKVLRTSIVADAGADPPGTVLDDALTIACGQGAVRVLEVQRAGKRPMAAAELLRGFPIGPGTRLNKLG